MAYNFCLKGINNSPQSIFPTHSRQSSGCVAIGLAADEDTLLLSSLKDQF